MKKTEYKKLDSRMNANTALKAVRVSSGLTQLDVATRAGLNLRTYQCYEQGIKPIEGAKLDTLLKICLVLKCEIKDIIDDPEIVDLIRQYE